MIDDGPRGPGRPRRATASHVAAAGLQLIRENGFDATSVADIAAAAGIGRSTFFRYFATKDEILWHCVADQVGYLEARLRAFPAGVDPFDAVTRTLIDSTRDVAVAEAGATRDLMDILADRADLAAPANALAARRRASIGSFIAGRSGDATGVMPTAFAHAIDAGMAAAARLFSRGGAELSSFVAACVRPVQHGFASAYPAARNGMG